MNLDRSLSLSAALLSISLRGWGTSLPPAGIIIDRVRSNWKTVMASLSLPGFPSSLSASSSRDASLLPLLPRVTMRALGQQAF